MNQLKRFYNQNRKQIWRIIIIIAFLFALLQLANFMAKTKNEQEIKTAMAQQNYINNTKTNSTTGTNNNSEQISEQTTTNEKKLIINRFVNLCNQRNLEEAYNMLTDDCKQEMFNNIDLFNSIYYSSTFENTEKQATIENWDANTYMVKFTRNPLSTGKIATTKEEQKIDYITVVKEEDNYKLNINSYIGYKKLEKTKEQDDIKIEVIGKHAYIEYETYDIKVTNNSQEEFQLDRLYNYGTIYIQDSKGAKYKSYSGELTEEMLTIASGHAKQVEIRFFSGYVSDRKMKEMFFNDASKNNKVSAFKVDL